MIPGRAEQPALRVAVLFDSAGFVQTLPLTGAAARTVHLNAALHARGCPTQLLLCDLNPDSRPSTGWPLPVSYLDYAEVYGRPDRLIARLRALEPDLLVMSNTELTVRYGRAVADAAGTALVYEMHDDEAGLLASLGSQPAECRAAALLQSAAAVSADGVIAFTGRDAARARELGARVVHLVPCGATVPDPWRTAEKPPRVDGPARVGFVGNLYYEPNLRALDYLAHRLVPHLGERAVVDVFGRYPPAARGLAAEAIAANTLVLHGPVGDLAGALAQMTLAVAPLDSGGGMKIKMLDYLAAGLATVGTEEAFVGLARPEQVGLVSRDATMRDLPALVDVLLDAPALREELGARARERVVRHYGWAAVAGSAQHAYQVIVATTRAHRGPHPPVVPWEVAELARRPPYWLTEWRRREAQLQDNVPMTEQAPAHTGDSPQARAGGLAVDVECARLAATAALGVRFDAEVAAGYAGRSMVFFAPQAVLKVYTHRPGERAHREIAGIILAATHAPGVRVAEVLGHDDVPGGLSWVALTRLPGGPLSREQLASPVVARQLGRIAARLHAIPLEDLDALPAHARRLRELPASDPAGAEAGHRLLEALEALEAHQRPCCERGFVHGDFSSRNVFLPHQPLEELGGQRPGVIDFEGCGVGCVYDDLATLVMQDGLLGAADVEQLLAGYQDERAALGHPRPPVDRDHLTVHLGWRARWVLQWAIEIDKPLTEQVLTLIPTLLAALVGRRAEASR